MMSKVRAALLCYRYYAAVPLVLCLPGCWIYAMERLVIPLLLMKALTDVLIWYFITATAPHRLFYYYNLHVSRRFLFVMFIVTDLFIFRILLWLTAIMFQAPTN
ncbi:MAG: hypothetical protein IAE95_04890 [Chitinophagaceae bacterium]|nr:hypothetical protein [Chitinophagaceae bacterium]